MTEQSNREQTKEALYTFTYAAAILDAASANNMAWIKEAIITASKQYGVDVSKTTDTLKVTEGYKKAFMDVFISRGLLVENAHGKYTVNPDPQKAKEYGNIIFSFKCKGQEIEVIKAAASIVKGALTAKESTLEFIAKALNLTPEQTSLIGKSLLTVIGTLETINSKLRDVVKAVKEHVFKDILQFESHEPTNAFEKKAISVLSKEASKDIEKKINGFSEIKGPSIAEAYFPDERKKKVIDHINKTIEKDTKERDIVNDCIEFMRDIAGNRMSLMVKACLEINEECNKDGRVPVNIQTGLKTARHITEYTIPHIISFAAGAEELIKDMTIGNVSRGLLSLSSFVHRGDDSKIQAVRAAAKLTNMLIRGVDWPLSIAAKYILPAGEFTRAEYDIRHFNIKETGARERGKNFAKIYGALNVYRAGRAEYVVGAFNTFKMRDADKMWALSYLLAGTNGTKAGVLFDVPRDGKIGEKYAVSQSHNKKLEEKAEKTFEKYLKLSEKSGFDKVISKMEKDFIKVHHKAIEESKALRNKEQLSPLSEQTHFNHIYDNAPVKEFAYIKTVDMTKAEYKENDLNKVFNEFDAICIDGKNSLSMQLLGEDHIVTATVDEHDLAVNMGIVQQAYESDYKDHNDENAKNSVIRRIGEKEKDLTEIALHNMYASTFERRDVGIKISYKWEDVISKLIKTDNYTAFLNTKTKEFGFSDDRTKVRLTLTNCEPRPELSDGCLTIKHFAKEVMDAELKAICDEKGITKEDIEKLYEPVTYNLNNAEKRVALRIDPENKLSKLQKTMELMTKDFVVSNVIDVEKRTIITDSLDKQLKDDKLPGLSEKAEMELTAFKGLEQTDPKLAICRSFVPECEREGDLIVAHTSNGERLAINIKTYEIEGFDLQNKEIRELYNELFAALDEISKNADHEIEEEMQPDIPEAERE